jgi:hypothetical protein
MCAHGPPVCLSHWHEHHRQQVTCVVYTVSSELASPSSNVRISALLTSPSGEAELPPPVYLTA